MHSPERLLVRFFVSEGQKEMYSLSRSKEYIIELRDLQVSYGEVQALRGVDLTVGEGEWLLVTGPSGCGKSTLARTLSGLIPGALPARATGEVVVAGRDLLAASLPEVAQTVGMVFQNPASQLFHLSVAEEVAFGPRNLGLSEEEVRARVTWALEAVGIEALADRRPDKLSGGQKQLTAVAAVLAMRPRVLVLDEPTASLDVDSTRQVMDALRRVNERWGITLVMIEHRLPLVGDAVDRVCLMDGGRMAVQGQPGEVLGDPTLQKRYGLRRPADQPMAAWGELIEGHGAGQPGEHPLLRMEGVSAGYGGEEVIQGINLRLYPGEFVSLVGANGAGKSTLALTAAGLLRPQQGRVKFGDGGRPKPGLDVALLFQNPAEQLFADSVEEEVAFAPHNYHRYDGDRQDRALREAGLKGLNDRRPTTLSMGQQLRTALAANIAICPRLVILDEPTLGQDWGHLARLMNYIKELNRQGMTILLISHDYKLVHHFTDRVLQMKGGRIVRRGRLNVRGKRKEEV